MNAERTAKKYLKFYPLTREVNLFSISLITSNVYKE